MQPIQSNIRKDSKAFQANAAAMQTGLNQLKIELSKVTQGGGEKYNKRHMEKGKLLPRNRIEKLLDENSFFLELCPFAGIGMEGEPPGTAVVGGIGLVSGVECLIIANEATHKGGALTEMTMNKLARLAQISLQNRLPTIYLVESAGAELTQQSKVFVPGGREFRDISRRSKKRIPTISVVFGNSTAGGAYIPGMSDYVVMVKNQARVFLAGPPLVKMATGEVVDEESLGGAEMHSKISGLADYLAENELDGLRLAREIVENLNWKKPNLSSNAVAKIEEPLYPMEDLLGLAPVDLKTPLDPREILARLLDGSRFSEFKTHYGKTLITGFARIHGYPIGILANHGVLFSESAAKGAQFIELCNQQNTPLLFLQNIAGFMVGKKAEEGGIIRNGAKLINAVANSTVPAITLMVGGSYGAGNYAMSGRAFEPRFLFTWPNHRIAVMGGKQLSGVLETIKRDAAAKEGRKLDEAALAASTAQFERQIDEESNAFFSSARLWDDGILDPRDTRSVLAICLSVVFRKVKGTMAWGVFRH